MSYEHSIQEWNNMSNIMAMFLWALTTILLLYLRLRLCLNLYLALSFSFYTVTLLHHTCMRDAICVVVPKWSFENSNFSYFHFYVYILMYTWHSEKRKKKTEQKNFGWKSELNFIEKKMDEISWEIIIFREL